MGEFMSIWALVPVKPLNRAKSRLAGVLSAEQRYELAETMLKQVLSLLSEVPQVAGTLVISRDTKVLALARDMEAKTLQERSTSDLNPALTRATEVLRVWKAGAILILPADLPFLTASDVTGLIRQLDDEMPSVVIATDRFQDGTNALLVRPPGLIDYAYGVGSFERHKQAAHRAGAIVRVYESPTLALDIDEPNDLIEYNRLLQGTIYRFLTPFIPDNSLIEPFTD